MVTGSWTPTTTGSPVVTADVESLVTAVFPNNRWTGEGYDDAGWEATAPGQSMSYTAEDQVRTAVMGAVTTQYSYDGLGRRRRRRGVGRWA